MPNNKEELLNLWKEIFSQVYEASYYTQLFACSYLCRSSAHLDTETVKKNLEIIDKHKNFFSQLEYGISYAVVLSIVKLFEPKNRLSLLYLSSEAKKFKITCDDLKNGLAEEDCETLKKLETARHNFFAHRNKEFSEVILPSRDKIFCLLKAIASFLNSIGMNFKNAGLESTHQYLWKEGFAEAVTKDFQLVLDNLYRGEHARITEIEVEYSEKL